MIMVVPRGAQRNRDNNSRQQIAVELAARRNAVMMARLNERDLVMQRRAVAAEQGMSVNQLRNQMRMEQHERMRERMRERRAGYPRDDGTADVPPSACPKGAVFLWGALQIFIGIDVLIRVFTDHCDWGADIEYNQCIKPYVGCPPAGSGISSFPDHEGGCDQPGTSGAMPNGQPDTAASVLDMTTTQFFDSCCALTGCCANIGTMDVATETHPPHAHTVPDGTFPPLFTPNSRHSVQGEACCDVYCFDTVDSSSNFFGDEVAQNFLCEGYSYWVLAYFASYVMGLVGVHASSKEGAGAGPACMGLGLGSILLYVVWVRVVPSGKFWHFLSYSPNAYMQYTFMSNLLLWAMSRRARVQRLQYELRHGSISRIQAEARRNAALAQAQAQIDAAEQGPPVEPLHGGEGISRAPLEAPGAVQASPISVVVEGVSLSRDELSTYRNSMSSPYSTVNPLSSPSGVVVKDTEIPQVANLAQSEVDQRSTERSTEQRSTEQPADAVDHAGAEAVWDDDDPSPVRPAESRGAVQTAVEDDI